LVEGFPREVDADGLIIISGREGENVSITATCEDSWRLLSQPGIHNVDASDRSARSVPFQYEMIW
jgi:hypothetical protein